MKSFFRVALLCGLLVEIGVSCMEDIKNKELLVNLFCNALKHDDVVMVDKLLSKASHLINANTVIDKNNLTTPLMHASSKDMIELLVRHGADLNGQDKNGNTPLHFAVFNSSLYTAKRLIFHGANPEIKNSKGYIPAAYIRDDKEMKRQDFLIGQFFVTKKIPLSSNNFCIPELKLCPLVLFSTDYKSGDMYLHCLLRNCLSFKDTDYGCNVLKKFLEHVEGYIKSNTFTNREIFFLLTHKNKIEGTLFHMAFYEERYDLALILLDFFSRNCDGAYSSEEKKHFFKQRNSRKFTLFEILNLYKNSKKKNFKECLKTLEYLKTKASE